MKERSAQQLSAETSYQIICAIISLTCLRLLNSIANFYSYLLQNIWLFLIQTAIMTTKSHQLTYSCTKSRYLTICTMDKPALTKIQSEPQAPCGLMKLPPEMRNMIYQWSLVHHTWNWAVDISTEQQPPFCEHVLRSDKRHSRSITTGIYSVSPR
jgi:hypothetical protein